jgi:hypothetical protein
MVAPLVVARSEAGAGALARVLLPRLVRAHGRNHWWCAWRKQRWRRTSAGRPKGL